MISSDSIRGYNDTIILSLLMQGDSYGYELSKKIREGTQEVYIIKETTLYSTFTRLEKQGYLTSYPGNQTHGKKRTYYSISPLGKEYLETKRQEWELTKKVVDYFLKESMTNESN
ncbi:MULTISPECIES: PadR family transcriptional regulator [Enterococcus]|uniref:PadR family transcriptional regulator n=1 Tax=Enterococcus alcedinis TaxID=1274384 RepID=A0A917JFM5_9ENTE|nr:PadR family transcriptional regulator [Enterococcus alcedinis]MBP2100923.1 DNA-binding PadR family transcriptional regulator [Enterococcus alcedinis]GGI64781.1 PadR family transcriptional regulator [Enterococcus alcedinis]